jgi:Prolipoprotein diacylglyceryltransferase
VPFGLVGGRLYHVATDWEKYFGPAGNPIDALKIWQGGLGIWGAVALGGVGAWIGCRRRGVPLPLFADAVAPGIVVAQAIGRLGNWFNQELFGRPTELPWGLEIYNRVDPATGAPDPLGGVALDHTPIMVVQPTFLYELIWNLLVAALVVWADRRFRLGHGRAFALYVAGYTAGRFVIEQLRSDDATRVFGDIRINVVVSVVVFAGAVLYLLLVRRPREVFGVPEVSPSAAPEPTPAREGTAAAGGAAALAAAGATATLVKEKKDADPARDGNSATSAGGVDAATPADGEAATPGGGEAAAPADGDAATPAGGDAAASAAGGDSASPVAGGDPVAAADVPADAADATSSNGVEPEATDDGASAELPERAADPVASGGTDPATPEEASVEDPATAADPAASGDRDHADSPEAAVAAPAEAVDATPPDAAVPPADDAPAPAPAATVDPARDGDAAASADDAPVDSPTDTPTDIRDRVVAEPGERSS